MSSPDWPVPQRHSKPPSQGSPALGGGGGGEGGGGEGKEGGGEEESEMDLGTKKVPMP